MSLQLPLIRETPFNFLDNSATDIFERDAAFNDILEEMDRLMAEYVDPRHLDPFNNPEGVDLTFDATLRELPGVDAPSGCLELWTAIVDNRRLILTTISIFLASAGIAASAVLTLPLLGATLFIASAAVVLLGVGGLGLWWTINGDSTDKLNRMYFLRSMRCGGGITQEECWNLRRELSNKWKFREHLELLIARLSHEGKISRQEQQALIADLNHGTWVVIDEVLAFLKLRLELGKAVLGQGEGNVETPRFVLEILEGLAETGDWRRCFEGETPRLLQKFACKETIIEFMGSLAEIHPSLEPSINHVKLAMGTEDAAAFISAFQGLLSQLERIELDTVLIPENQKEQFLRLLASALTGDAIVNVAEKLSHWAMHHEWYIPINKLFCDVQNLPDAHAEEIKEKVEAFAKGYLCFLMEQNQLGGCDFETGRKYFEVFFGKWWSQTMCSLIEKAATAASAASAVSPAGNIQDSTDEVPKEEVPVLILLSYGGGGHRSAGDGAKSILEAESRKPGCRREYKVEFANAPHGIFRDVDLVEKVCAFFGITNADGHKIKDGEDLYNEFLQGGWSRVADVYFQMGLSYYGSHQAYLEKVFEEYLDQRAAEGKPTPQIIFSNMPLINGIVSAVCARRGISFGVTTTDVNSCNYINGVSYPQTDYRSLKYAVAFPDYSVFSQFAAANLQPRQVEVTGFPVKPQFTISRDRSFEGIEAAKRALEVPFTNPQGVMESPIFIPAGKKVVALSMGSQGSELVYKYLDKLIQIDSDFHIVVLCGKKQEFKDEVLRRYTSHVTNERDQESAETVTITAVEHSSRVADIMAASHLLIGKPGPNTILEAVHIGIPVILENTSSVLSHEKPNIGFVKDYQLGESIEDMEDLPGIVLRYLHGTEVDESEEARIKQQKLVVLQNRDFSKNFPILVEEMLQQAGRMKVEKAIQSAFEALSGFNEEATFLEQLFLNKDLFQELLMTSFKERFPELEEAHLQVCMEQMGFFLSELTIEKIIQMSPSAKKTLAIKLSEVFSEKKHSEIYQIIDQFVKCEDKIGFEEVEEVLEGLDSLFRSLKPIKEVFVTYLDLKVKQLKTSTL